MPENTHIENPKTPAELEERRPKSKGGQIFDAAVYGAMNYAGTFFLTLFLANELKHGKTFEKFYKAADEKLIKMGVHEKVREPFLGAFITFWGGNVMVPIVRLAESFRTPIVIKLNEMTGDKTDPKKIKDAPKQTWGSLLHGRAVAFASVFALMVGTDQIFGDQYKAYSKNVGNFFSKNFSHLFTKVKDPKAAAYNFGEIAALDMFATAASTALLYLSSHRAANKREKKIALREGRPYEQIVDKVKEPRTEKSEAIDHAASADQPQKREQPEHAPAAQIRGDKRLAGVAQAQAAPASQLQQY